MFSISKHHSARDDKHESCCAIKKNNINKWRIWAMKRPPAGPGPATVGRQQPVESLQRNHHAQLHGPRQRVFNKSYRYGRCHPKTWDQVNKKSTILKWCVPLWRKKEGVPNYKVKIQQEGRERLWRSLEKRNESGYSRQLEQMVEWGCHCPIPPCLNSVPWSSSSQSWIP